MTAARKGAGADRRALILAVEDDSAVAEFYEIVFPEAGYRVVVARDGREALELAKICDPSLIILDLGLPNIGGFELAVLFRQNPLTAHVPQVMVSAHCSPERRRQAVSFGIDEFVAKPFDLDELIAAIERARGVTTSARKETARAHAAPVRRQRPG